MLTTHHRPFIFCCLCCCCCNVVLILCISASFLEWCKTQSRTRAHKKIHTTIYKLFRFADRPQSLPSIAFFGWTTWTPTKQLQQQTVYRINSNKLQKYICREMDIFTLKNVPFLTNYTWVEHSRFACMFHLYFVFAHSCGYPWFYHKTTNDFVCVCECISLSRIIIDTEKSYEKKYWNTNLICAAYNAKMHGERCNFFFIRFSSSSSRLLHI